MAKKDAPLERVATQSDQMTDAEFETALDTDLTEQEKQELEKSKIWKRRTSPEAHEETVPAYGLDTETARAAELIVTDVRESTVTLHHAEVEATILANELGGKIKQADLIETASRLSVLYDLERIKQSKGYKGAQVRHARTGELVTVNKWDDYCEAIGRDRKVIDEDLKNLATFGDNLIKLQDSHGIGYRSLRRIRAGLLELSPEEQETALIRLTGAEDKEEVLGLVDELSVKLAAVEKEKADLAEELKDQKEITAKRAKGQEKAEIRLEKILRLQKEDPEKFNEEREKETGKALAEAIANATREVVGVAGICAAVYAEEGISPIFVDAVNGQVSAMFGRFCTLLLDAGVDIDFSAYLPPEGFDPVVKALIETETGNEQE